MSTLKEAAQTIQTEKNTKVLAKNIKKDITMFGITGTYEGSGSENTNVRVFSTVQEMNNNTGNNKGDIGVIYQKGSKGVNSMDRYNSMTFLETVVLPETFDSYTQEDKINIHFGHTGYYYTQEANLCLQVTPTSASIFSFCIEDFGDESFPEITRQIKYTSSDGKTYSLTQYKKEIYDGESNTYDTLVDPEWIFNGYDVQFTNKVVPVADYDMYEPDGYERKYYNWNNIADAFLKDGNYTNIASIYKFDGSKFVKVNLEDL